MRSASIDSPAADAVELKPRLATAEAFAPFGWVRALHTSSTLSAASFSLTPALLCVSLPQLVEATEDGVPFGAQDAALELSGGTPRLYLMRLPPRGLQFSSFARHSKVTQCLAATGDTPWYIAVAPPPPLDAQGEVEVQESEVQLFEVRPPTAVCLRRNCWHSGPYFTDGPRLFYNLELVDTNQNDGNRASTSRPFRMQLDGAAQHT